MATIDELRAASREMRGQQPPPRPVLWREMESATEINRILNDPEVFPWIHAPGQERFEVSELVTNPSHVFLRCDGGVVFFTQHGEGVYDGHTNFLEGYRGAYSLRMTIAAIDWLFTHTMASFLFARIPVGNRPAIQNMRHLARHCGVRHWSRQERAWATDTGVEDLNLYALPLYDWLQHSKMLDHSAIRCRITVEDEFRRLGHLSRRLDCGETYDRMFACMIEMLRGGQPKGIGLFNIWAAAAMVPQVRLINWPPIVIDTGEALLRITDTSLRILKVHG